MSPPCVGTMTLPTLPPEILDFIVDHLHDDPITLKSCCLTSKSLFVRSRRHLFACVTFDPLRSSVRSWMKAFPDPSNSPAHYARSLCIRDSRVVSANACTWIRPFCHVQELSVNTFGWGGPNEISLVQLHGLSPTIKSLHLYTGVHTPIPEIIGLICSFPLLKDLSLHSTRESDPSGWATPQTSPKFTGSLKLNGENRGIIRRLLELPGGLHFSKIRVRCRVEDVDSRTIVDLVSKCSNTLKSLYLRYHHLATSRAPPPLDLSNAMKLKHLNFRWGRTHVRWITMTLQTVQSKDLRRITVFLRNILFAPAEETILEWHELDRLLVQLWISHSIRPRILYKDVVGGIVSRLLPELTMKGFTRHRGERQ
ncbi:hypothetical protein BJ322DRAFT_287392 [Thelephora terrestris]|uniref:F-box domain-containing protein n=1 Tax=Thelephora terrestris TaxID=56493 RepID=A0A9P6L3R0_9AGAM|nr:hypothetical protein BJ322DRAFT_287392 [Thelephora terrestris]